MSAAVPQSQEGIALAAHSRVAKASTLGSTAADTSERLGFRPNANPVRSWKPGKVWVARDGIFPKSPKCLNSFAPFESGLEALGHLHLSVDFRVRYYVCQPHTLQYWMPDPDGGQSKHQYTPDFAARTKDDRLLIIDTKASKFAADEKWTKREPFIRAAYDKEFGAELIVWMEGDLRAEPRLSNARTLYRHRFEPQDKSAELEVRRLLMPHGGSTIGRLCQEIVRAAAHTPSQVYGAIMRLALVGDLMLDERAKYGSDTSVRFRSDDA